ncbi:MAG: hypothetical protein L3J05_07290, partial [Robiginitomaculum sp.]|nr:hypothetical protein [Robiginitomaculum sp.]
MSGHTTGQTRLWCRVPIMPILSSLKLHLTKLRVSWKSWIRFCDYFDKDSKYNGLSSYVPKKPWIHLGVSAKWA